MRIYLASRFSRLKEMRSYAARLQDLGHDIRSRWIWRSEPNVEDLDGPDAARVAAEDVSDVLSSQCVILFTDPPRSPTRAGKEVEFGCAIGTGRHRLIVVGARSNVFHAFEKVERYESFHDRSVLDGGTKRDEAGGVMGWRL
jgi:hypothetical protein